MLEERVFFDTNSYRIRARSAPLLSLSIFATQQPPTEARLVGLGVGAVGLGLGIGFGMVALGLPHANR